MFHLKTKVIISLATHKSILVIWFHRSKLSLITHRVDVDGYSSKQWLV